jgi:putative iron-dependent peroxidase
MKTSQSGIFSLGTSSHVYLEWDIANGRTAAELVTAIASLREPRTTIGGVNLVSGFRPELWNRWRRTMRPPDCMDSTSPSRAWKVSRCRRRSTMR